MRLLELEAQLNTLLAIADIGDSSHNGLQIGTDKEVRKVGYAVDADLATMEKAVEQGCDVLVVHHGISWGNNLQRIQGNTYDRIAFLMKHDLALLAYHLPLDAHQELGNNAQLAKLLSLTDVKPFSVGVIGTLSTPISVEALAERLQQLLSTTCDVYAYGSEITRLAIVSGSGSREVEAASKIADCLLTGDISYGTESVCKELAFNLIAAGHYETETFGVRALLEYVEKQFGVNGVFLSS